MSRVRHSDTDAGWIRRELKKIWRAIEQSNAAKRLQAATIGFGGLTLKEGGAIKILYANEELAFQLAPNLAGTANTAPGAAFQMLEEGGRNVLTFFRIPAGADPFYPDGTSRFVGNFDLFLAAGSDQLLLSGPDGASVVASAGSGLILSSDFGVLIQHTTTASAANCFIDPVSARVYRVSSSRRYKQDIVDADIDVDAVLALVPRQFRRRDEVEELGDDAPTYVGFIAEEAADLGLDDWVTTDDEGPESFAYAHWGVALQAVAQRQAAQIEDLERRLSALGG